MALFDATTDRCFACAKHDEPFYVRRAECVRRGYHDASSQPEVEHACYRRPFAACRDCATLVVVAC